MSQTSDPTPSSSHNVLVKRFRNLLIVMVAVILSTAIFLGLRAETSTASLSTMAANATPIEVALVNGKPTLMEFYADWCTSCQAMAPDLNELKQEYSERVNFVMLNVDNSKWLPEILNYRVDGIPHFVFLNPKGTAVASAIGEQPKSVMATNLEALISGDALPYAKPTGKTSSFSAPVSSQGQSDPRSHGSQVAN